MHEVGGSYCETLVGSLLRQWWSCSSFCRVQGMVHGLRDLQMLSSASFVVVTTRVCFTKGVGVDLGLDVGPGSDVTRRIWHATSDWYVGNQVVLKFSV